MSEPFTETSPEVDLMLPELTSFAAWLVTNAEMLRDLPDVVVDENLRRSAMRLLNTAMGLPNPSESEHHWQE